MDKPQIQLIDTEPDFLNYPRLFTKVDESEDIYIHNLLHIDSPVDTINLNAMLRNMTKIIAIHNKTSPTASLELENDGYTETI